MAIDQRSLSIFIDSFKKYNEDFVIIGGTSCFMHFNQHPIETFRTTKDIDIVVTIIMENKNTKQFAANLKDFIDKGNYTKGRKQEDKVVYYRFYTKKSDFPDQIELFMPVEHDIFRDEHIGKLKDELYPFSGILLDSEYVNLLKNNTEIIEGIRFSSILMTIIMKMKAWKHLRHLASDGVNIRSKNIKKHNNDIYRLWKLLTEKHTIEVGKNIYEELIDIKTELEEENIDLINFGIKGITKEEILDEIIKKIKVI